MCKAPLESGVLFFLSPEPSIHATLSLMTSGHLLVLGASILWIMLCMRFWWAIDREHTWQRRFIAIGAGLGGGLIYLIGTMMLEMLKEAPPPVQDGTEVRVMSRPASGVK